MMFRKLVLIPAITVALAASSVSLPAYAGHSDVIWGAKLYARGGKILSESEVIRKVKRQYNAEVLRIDYNERRQVYRVRVLMPNGKVRNLTISARG